MKRLLLVSIAGLSIQLTAGACGGGDDSTSVTKAEFLKQGNAICWEALKTQEAAFQQIVTEATEEEATKFDPEKQKELVDRVTSSVEKMVGELSELGAPSGEDDAVGHILTGYAQGASEAKNDPKRLFAGEAFKDADAAATSFGLTKCGRM